MKEFPRPLLWIFETRNLKGKKYIDDLNFIKENTATTHVAISVRDGVNLGNVQQCHEPFREIVEHAHSIGLKVVFHIQPREGFYNAALFTDNPAPVDQVELFPIPDPKRAQAIVNDVELLTDECGHAEYLHRAVWGRSKVMPIYSEIVRAYTFDKTGDGTYDKSTLRDVTDKVRIISSRTHSTELEIDLGRDGANKTVFILLAQYYNCTATSDDWDVIKNTIDSYKDIPFDGIVMDEYGYLPLNTAAISKGEEPPFRGRMYSRGMASYCKNELDRDLDRLLFDMRYAPVGEEKVKVKAINEYFELLRVFPLGVERKIHDYVKEVFGSDSYVSCHNTFHNSLESDEIWTTACNWWDIPRDIGHTDEDICFPVRYGIMLACKYPIMIDMFYSKDENAHYEHMIEGAPYACREFHHAYSDFFWGKSFTEPEFVKNVKKLDTHISSLDSFQNVYPKMDLLVIFGSAAQNNWYPDESARSIWDINGTLHIQDKCTQMWNAGYRCALAPDYAIEDGRITFENGKVCFGGYEFSHCVFLYPQYGKKSTLEFMDKCHAGGAAVAAVGKCEYDFSGEPADLNIPLYESFSLSILEDIGCNKSAIDGGCVLVDGSFSLTGRGLLDGSLTEFDFTVGDTRYSGAHTGLIAYRDGKCAFATSGSTLFVNGNPITLDYLPEL